MMVRVRHQASNTKGGIDMQKRWTKRSLKWLGVGVVATIGVAAVVALPLFEHGFRFLVNYGAIRQAIETADATERPLPPAVSGQLRFHLRGDTSWTAARLLVTRLDHHRGTMDWQYAWGSWTVMTRLFLTEQDRETIIARYSYLGGGQIGFSTFSKSAFGRSLRDLSALQVATIMVLMSHPSEETAGQLAVRRDEFLKRYGAWAVHK